MPATAPPIDQQTRYLFRRKRPLLVHRHGIKAVHLIPIHNQTFYTIPLSSEMIRHAIRLLSLAISENA